MLPGPDRPTDGTRLRAGAPVSTRTAP